MPPKPQSKPNGKAPAPSAGFLKKSGPEYKYPDFDVEPAFGPNAITASRMMEILGWETEEEYIARRKTENPELADDQLTYGDDFLLVDENGKKVRCANNHKNRPFREIDAKKYCQIILDREWAGPSTMPNETINGSSVKISRMGEVVDGNHSGIGLVLAYQKWMGPKKHLFREKWPTEPVIDTLLMFGVSDNPKVIQTLDNVVPRSESDVIYTSGRFDDLNRTERLECSRMLAKAIDFMWVRGRPGLGKGNNKALDKYQTRTSTMTFLDNHETLIKCVRHLFEENKERAISVLRLSPGMCAGMLYLMGSSNSDGDNYRNMDDPSEKGLDWSNWDRAIEFWQEIVKGEGHGTVIQNALKMLVDADTGLGGRISEKTAILAKAWNKFLTGDGPTDDDLKLDYTTDENGIIHLHDFPDFGGIDVGPSQPKAATEEEVSEEQVQTEKKNVRSEKAEEMLRKAEGVGSPKDVAEAKEALAKKATPAPKAAAPAAKAAASKPKQKAIVRK